MGGDIECTDCTSGAEIVELDTHSCSGMVAQSIVRLQPVDTPADTASASKHSFRATLQFAACCWMKMLNGWSDGTSGPLIPRLQEVYGVCFLSSPVVLMLTHVQGQLHSCFLDIHHGMHCKLHQTFLNDKPISSAGLPDRGIFECAFDRQIWLWKSSFLLYAIRLGHWLKTT